MKKMFVMMVGCLLAGAFTVGAAQAATLVWDRNTEADIKQYHVYTCKVQGCAVMDIGANWVATILHSASTQPMWPIPAGTVGAATVTAEDTSGNISRPAVPVNFSTVQDLPPAAPLNLRIQP